ncbi:putative S-layer protein [Cylindrospermum stagnale PCC 7417]|uniref:Putative S-layer protein n=1 Tax=Cylindrospermum stagnale PCC 7417 TaxID=56107 RepID=K9WV91_9NOST|nr:iron uptake porin [Cylindrospermum stagnale]AFZ24108.1 putative S-layer protein [Cylindrospermum stagnale PCC 7417]
MMIYNKLLFLSGTAVFCLAAPALAVNANEENIRNLQVIYSEKSENLDNISQSYEDSDSNDERLNSVSQLSDIQPSDWAFTALQSLVERYGVIAGYGDGTFKGNRPLTRYEFAAGLQAALDKINQLVAAGLTEQVKKADLETLQKLQTEFATELTNLTGRIADLEARNANLTAQQFSTTVGLGGQVILGLATGSGGKPPGKGEANTILTQLTQLQLVSSFNGKDRFRIGLVTGNSAGDSFGNPEAFNTNMARLAWQADYENQVKLDSLEYRVAGLGDRVVFTFKPVGFSLGSVLSVNSPYADAGGGAISLFAGSSPLFKIGSLDAGLGFDWLLSDTVRLQFAYGTRNTNDSNQGLFSTDHSALGVQLLYKPTSSLITGLTYINAYAKDGQLDTGTGSGNADTSGGLNAPAQIHALNASMKWQLTNQVVFSLWGGAVVTDALTSDAVALTTTYQASLGLYDPFGRKGDLFGLIIGQPLKLNNGYLFTNIDRGNSTHYEVFYRFLVNDNIAITPGFFIVTDPGHISSNNDIFVGAIRTTFSF